MLAHDYCRNPNNQWAKEGGGKIDLCKKLGSFARGLGFSLNENYVSDCLMRILMWIEWKALTWLLVDSFELPLISYLINKYYTLIVFVQRTYMLKSQWRTERWDGQRASDVRISHYECHAILNEQKAINIKWCSNHSHIIKTLLLNTETKRETSKYIKNKTATEQKHS